MKSTVLAVALVGVMGMGMAHAAKPHVLVARENINGLTRLHAHQVLTRYCMSHGFGVVHDSLSSVACRKRVDGSDKSFLAEKISASVEPYTPEMTLHFRFVPDHAGMMRIQATGTMTRRGRGGYVEHHPVSIANVQAMLKRSRDAWYAQHPQFAPSTGV